VVAVASECGVSVSCFRHCAALPCISARDATDYTASLAASPGEPFVLFTLGGVVPDNQVHAARLFYGPTFLCPRTTSTQANLRVRTRLITKVDIDISDN
jgi:hypothetical protein